MSDFGKAKVKKEGSMIAFNTVRYSKRRSSKEETFYFEWAFTKAEYAKLAAALARNDDPLIKELREEFAERAVNGYGGGL